MKNMMQDRQTMLENSAMTSLDLGKSRLWSPLSFFPPSSEAWNRKGRRSSGGRSVWRIRNISKYDGPMLFPMSYCEWYCGWKKSCTTLDGWNPINNGMFTTYQLVQDFATIHSMMFPCYPHAILWMISWYPPWLRISLHHFPPFSRNRTR